MGYVYILENDLMPGLIKIGHTSKTPEERVKELSAPTGVPTPFKVAFKLPSEKYKELEKEMHRKLSDYRVNSNREFFKYPVDQAIRQMALAYFELNEFEVELNEFEKAANAAKKAVRLDSNYQPAFRFLENLKQEHYDRGLASLAGEEYAQAILELTPAIKIDPKFIEAIHALGLAYLGTQNFDEAKNAAQEALKIDSNYHPAKALLDAINPAKKSKVARQTPHEAVTQSNLKRPPRPPATSLNPEVTLTSSEPTHQLLDDISAQDAKVGKRTLWLKIGLVTVVLAGVIASFGIYRILNFLMPTPPELSITQIVFHEPSGNKFLDGGEKGSIKAKIENMGGRATDFRLELTPSSHLNLRYNPITTMQELDANSERIITIPISANRNVQAQAVRLKIQLVDKNGNQLTVKKTLSFKTLPNNVPGPFLSP